MRTSALRVRLRLRRAIRSTTVGRGVYRALRRARVRSLSRLDNVYHCCTQKTASQWIRGVLDDPLIHRRSGLEMVPYRHLGLRFARIEDPFPPRTLVAHLYVDYPTYAAIPKPEQYRTFFVLRDPRDVVVSWYFSAKYSHRSAEGVDEIRPMLQRLTDAKGFCYLIDRLEDWGSFKAQRSWVDAAEHDPNVRIFRYEDLAEDPQLFTSDLLDWLEIRPTPSELRRVLKRHAFSAHAGRTQGTEDISSHYRKGVAGDWAGHFDEEISTYFREVTGDLVEHLGYGGDH